MSGNYPLLSKYVALLDKCCEKQRFDTRIVMSQIEVIVGVGAYVNDMIINFGSNPPLPVLEKMMESVDHWSFEDGSLGGKTSVAIYRLIDLHHDKEFYEKLDNKIRCLLWYMRKLFTHPSAKIKEEFRELCERTPPLNLAQEFMSQVKKGSQTDIDAVLASLLILECLLNGMFWNQNMHGPNQLKREITKYTN